MVPRLLFQKGSNVEIGTSIHHWFIIYLRILTSFTMENKADIHIIYPEIKQTSLEKNNSFFSILSEGVELLFLNYLAHDKKQNFKKPVVQNSPDFCL